jgi:hypothetical protein
MTPRSDKKHELEHADIKQDRRRRNATGAIGTYRELPGVKNCKNRLPSPQISVGYEQL